MPATLSPEDVAFNAGLDVAIEYHETRARSADQAGLAMPRGGNENGAVEQMWKPLRLAAIRIISIHRGFADELRLMRRRTDAEIAADAGTAED